MSKGEYARFDVPENNRFPAGSQSKYGTDQCGHIKEIQQKT